MRYKKYILPLCFVFIVLLIPLISAGKDLIFIQGPSCDIDNIDFEAKYTGGSSINAPNIHAFVTIPTSEGGSRDYGLIGTWSKTYLESGDIASFHSSNFGGFYPELNKEYKLYLDTNTIDGAWSNEVSFICLNKNLHKVYKCVDGNWVNTGEEAYCRDNDNLYISIGGSEHCVPSTTSSVNDGTWCYKISTKTKVYRCADGVKTYLGEVEYGNSNFCNHPSDTKYLLPGNVDKCLSYEPNECKLNSEQIEDKIKRVDYSSLDKIMETVNTGDTIFIERNGESYAFRINLIGDDWADIYLGDEKLAMNIRDKVLKDLDNDGKDDVFIELLEANGENAKIEFSKPSKINLNKGYLYYGIIALFVVIIFFMGIFYISKRKKRNKNISKPKIEELKLKKETKEEIPTNITEAITITGLGVKKGSNIILENINFSVKRGDFVALLGPSGSGKSMIIEILAGRKKPSYGKIKIFEEDIDKKEIKSYVGFVPQGNEIYLKQTVQQNLENSAIKWGIRNSKEKILKVLEQVNLSERKNLIANKLSGGQQKLLSLAMELIREPELLILDEPTTGLDPNTRNHIITILCNLSRYDKKTVLITTHFMDDAEECDEIVIINNKKVVVRGSPERLKKMLPGSGRIVSLILDNSNKDILEKIKNIKGVERVIAEGRNLNILTNNPNAIDIASKIHEYGVEVNESKVSKATMKEVFVFFTGKSPEE